MQFDIGTIKHLGLHMYSTLPPVIGELVSNAWDADATEVRVNIPTGHMTDGSEIVVVDNGAGMTDEQVRKAYLVVGRDRRDDEGRDTSVGRLRPLMGRKGIGKFAGFGIAVEMEVETVSGGQVSRFIMDYEQLQRHAADRRIEFDPLPATGEVSRGTRVTLRRISRYRTRSVNIQRVRRGLARRFSIIGAKNDFEVIVNGTPITVAERDLTRLLDTRPDGTRYLWEFDEEIAPDSGWRVTGWIGALDRTSELEDGIQRGIAIMARGKLVQEPFVFDATVGQQYALSYLIGELHAEFVDAHEDTIGTTRNSLVWDTEANQALLGWGQRTVNRIAREWAERRREDNEAALEKNSSYVAFKAKAVELGNERAVKIADKLVRDVIKRDVTGGDAPEQESVVQMCLDFLEFDAFWELAEDINRANSDDPAEILRLFREWEVVEAKEMARVTGGRISTIEKLQELINKNALEVPILHNFLKEFPWVIDPRWTLVDDEVRYSQLLRDKFPEAIDVLPSDRRIDFLCVREAEQLVVVEIKRPQSKVSTKELEQLEAYVYFMRDYVSKTTDVEMQHKEVYGYILCGDLVDTPTVRGKRETLANSKMFVRRYGDLLGQVQRLHQEFLDRYRKLKDLRSVPALDGTTSSGEE